VATITAQCFGAVAMKSLWWNGGCLQTRYHSNVQVSVGNEVEYVKSMGK
jgi:hypothetical protein